MVQYRQVRIRRFGWRGATALIVAGALAAAALVLLLGLALVLVPIVAVAVLIARWRFKAVQENARRVAEQRRRSEYEAAGVIEGEFTVIGSDAGKIR